jgi:hypothetical protein
VGTYLSFATIQLNGNISFSYCVQVSALLKDALSKSELSGAGEIEVHSNFIPAAELFRKNYVSLIK